MDTGRAESLDDIDQRLRSIKRYLLLIAVLLVGIAVGIAGAAFFALRWYSATIDPTLAETRASIREVRDIAAETAALLAEAQHTMTEVRHMTGAVAPVVEQVQQTVREAQQTTEQVQAPLNLLRAVPILNWFIP